LNSFTAAGTGAIRGTVLDAGGAPISGDTVYIQAITGDPCGGWMVLRSTPADPGNGNYILVGLIPGTYYLRTYAEGFNYTEEWWSASSSVRSNRLCAALPQATPGSVAT